MPAEARDWRSPWEGTWAGLPTGGLAGDGATQTGGGSATQQLRGPAHGPERLGSPSVPLYRLAGCRLSSSEQKHRPGCQLPWVWPPVCRRGWVTHQITRRPCRAGAGAGAGQVTETEGKSAGPARCSLLAHTPDAPASSAAPTASPGALLHLPGAMISRHWAAAVAPPRSPLGCLPCLASLQASSLLPGPPTSFCPQGGARHPGPHKAVPRASRYIF